jgi:predicted RNase H-like HicB family nuclease
MVAATYKILIEQMADGQSSATVLELPDCQVIAITPQEAMSQVQTRLTERLATVQIVSIEIPAQSPQNPWIEFAGIFKDDPDFAEIAQAIRAERISTDSEWHYGNS